MNPKSHNSDDTKPRKAARSFNKLSRPALQEAPSPQRAQELSPRSTEAEQHWIVCKAEDFRPVASPPCRLINQTCRTPKSRSSDSILIFCSTRLSRSSHQLQHKSCSYNATSSFCERRWYAAEAPHWPPPALWTIAACAADFSFASLQNKLCMGRLHSP